MLGTTVNVLAIVAGAGAGLLARKSLPEQVKNTVMQGIGLSVLLIGMSMSLKTNQLLVVIISLVLGGLTGEFLNIEDMLDRIGRWVEARAGDFSGEAGKAFVSTSLIYCVGAMSIMGSIEDGLNGNPRLLFAKAILDGISAAIFSSTMGVGVVFSAIPVLIYQGTITLLAGSLKSVLLPALVTEMTATGGLLIVAIGLNLLGITRIRVGNLLPSIFLAVPLAAFLPRILPV